MCLIIKKPSGRTLPEDFLAETWRSNHDGWGYSYLTAGGLYVERGMSLDSLLARCQALPVDVEVFLHLRKATAGIITDEMAHPYIVRHGMLLMHNGTISNLVPPCRIKSDSWALARLLGDMLQSLSDVQSAHLIRTEGFAAMLSALIAPSRVVLLDTYGAVLFGQGWHTVSADEWSAEMDGILVSNTTAWTPRNRKNTEKQA